MRSDAATVEDYLASMPPGRREAMAALRADVAGAMPAGYEEVMNWGMITWQVPLADCPDTYNGKPLMYAALASQKNHMALYLCGLNCLPGLKDAFLQGFAAAGKKLDMGAACVRFWRLDQLDMASVRAAVAAVPSAEFIASARASRKSRCLHTLHVNSATE